MSAKVRFSKYARVAGAAILGIAFVLLFASFGSRPAVQAAPFEPEVGDILVTEPCGLFGCSIRVQNDSGIAVTVYRSMLDDQPDSADDWLFVAELLLPSQFVGVRDPDGLWVLVTHGVTVPFSVNIGERWQDLGEVALPIAGRIFHQSAVTPTTASVVPVIRGELPGFQADVQVCVWDANPEGWHLLYFGDEPMTGSDPYGWQMASGCITAPHAYSDTGDYLLEAHVLR